jgi:hypothetical protein
MTTQTKHQLKRIERYGDRWRALCKDCDFVGQPAGTPDNAMDSWTIHERETEGKL